MLKKTIGIVCITLALVCIGTTVYEFIAAKGNLSIWSADVLGAIASHAILMVIAVFLMARPTVGEEIQAKEV